MKPLNVTRFRLGLGGRIALLFFVSLIPSLYSMWFKAHMASLFLMISLSLQHLQDFARVIMDPQFIKPGGSTLC